MPVPCQYNRLVRHHTHETSRIGFVRRALAIALVALAFSVPASGDTFSEELWAANEDIYRAILRHPFLRGLQDGSLDPDIFAFYIVQDARYLEAFATALRATAAKAPRAEWARLLTADAEDSLQQERRLHDQVFAEHGIAPDAAAAMESTPDAFAYTSYLIATASSRPFEEAVTALLPCYWIYWEVGKALQAQGSPNARYQSWIDTYVSEGYAVSVQAIIDIVDEVARTASPAQRARMQSHFRRSSQYEWMFWDSSYRRPMWPPD